MVSDKDFGFFLFGNGFFLFKYAKFTCETLTIIYDSLSFFLLMPLIIYFLFIIWLVFSP